MSEPRAAGGLSGSIKIAACAFVVACLSACADQAAPADAVSAQDEGNALAANDADSPFTKAVDQLAQARGDAGALLKVRGAASLAGLQQQIHPADYGLVEPLRRHLKAENASTRTAAVSLLGVLAVSGRKPDSDPSVRTASDQATQAIISALDDADPQVRAEATHQASALEDPNLVPALLARLQDPQSLVRFQALSGLQPLTGGSDGSRIRDAARALLKDPDPQVRQLAALMAR